MTKTDERTDHLGRGSDDPRGARRWSMPSLVVTALALVLACAGRPYEPADPAKASFIARAQVQDSDDVRVAASVPSPEETRALYALDLYARGIQPVWLEVENRTGADLRFAPVSVDRDYFAPLEVAYMHRGGLSKPGRAALDRYLYETAMPRNVPAGSTQSGFVYTHARPGTKGFNVHLFGDHDGQHGFTFFVDVPGFVADHAAVDFEGLYAADVIEDHDIASLRKALEEIGCCTSGIDDQQRGIPFGVVLVADGTDLLHALLRAGWVETQSKAREGSARGVHHWRGRSADAVFRMQRQNARERNELRLWLAPMRAEGKQVWLGQITHYLGHGNKLADALVGARLDPDIDDARNYMLQVMWYSQGLARYGWSASGARVPFSDAASDFNGARWFSDGLRVVLWISGPTTSLLEADYVDWDHPTVHAERVTQ